MKGSLQIRSKKYYAVFNVKQSDGKRKTIWINTGLNSSDSKTAARRILEEIGDLLDDGLTKQEIESYYSIKKKTDKNILFEKPQSIETEKKPSLIPVMTPSGQIIFTPELPTQKLTPLYEYIKTWLYDKSKDLKIEESTYDGYESLCKNHLIPYFKKTELSVERTTFRELQEFFDYEAKRGNKKTGKGLSSKSLRDLRKILSMVFRSAKRDQLIFDNPCSYVKLPKQEQNEPRVLTDEQLAEFLSKIKDEDIYPVIYITIVYGLRRSEVLGLKWDSIDYDNMTVSIIHTVVKGKKIVEKDRTKTESSRRTYPMNEEIKNIFLQLKEDESINREKYGSFYKENEYVFKWADGVPLRPDFLTRKFKKLLEQNNMPDIRFHDLRHSCASLLASSGFQLKDIQEWLGHADIGTTANIYAHLFSERKVEILEKISHLNND